MYFDISKTMNFLIVAVLTLVILIVLVFLAKITDTSNPYRKAADMDDTYAPCHQWERVR